MLHGKFYNQRVHGANTETLQVLRNQRTGL